MKKDLKIVLDEIRSDESSEINHGSLYSFLQKANYFVPDEVFMIEQRAINLTDQRVKIFEFLKEKDDEVFIVLQKFCHKYNNTDLFTVIQTKLKEVERFDLIWVPLVPFNFDPNLGNELFIVCQNLKAHYEQDLELIEIQWQKFNVSGSLEMDVFYNQNIIVEDKNKKLKSTVKNFNELFLFSAKWKRIIITADAGYGKSTFVHEMTRRWVKGDEAWTKNFSFVFLFRLAEVGKHEAQSLRTLLTMSFTENDSWKVSQWLVDAEHLKDCLFIFDGLDELREEFCKEIDDLIFGRGVKLANVVVTFRPSKELEKKFEEVFCHNLYMSLQGYNEVGVKPQLEKFKINPNKVGKDLRDIIKVPLFNTLFCITHEEATICCLNICSAIEKFVNFACKRHRKTHSNFCEIEENEIVMILGQAAQNKFSLMKGVNIEYPNVTPQHLYLAVNLGLISKRSTMENFVFAHQTIAEYCAAYYWHKKSPLNVKNFCRNSKFARPECAFDLESGYSYLKVDFAEPEGGSLYSSDLLSCFLCHFNDEYKQFLWQNFKDYVPLLNEYDSLPKQTLRTKNLFLYYVPVSDLHTVMDKIEISTETTENDRLHFANVNFESGKEFENITKMKHLVLEWCSFKISPEEFFLSYKIKYLYMYYCTFTNWNQVGEDLKGIWKNNMVLEYLCINSCDFTVVNFLSFIMRHCKTLKTFKVLNSFEYEISDIRNENLVKESSVNFHYFDGWISELQNNEKLLHTIEHFELVYNDPIDLTYIFETFGQMVNLKKLVLKLRKGVTYFTKAEFDSLKLSYKNGLKRLEYLSFNLQDKDGKEINVNDFLK